MLSRVSLGGPRGTGGSSIVPVLACSNVVLDDPRTEVSSPCAERMDSELSALPLFSAPKASREELKTKGEESILVVQCMNDFSLGHIISCF